jgi:hypothetical protein
MVSCSRWEMLEAKFELDQNIRRIAGMQCSQKINWDISILHPRDT